MSVGENVSDEKRGSRMMCRSTISITIIIITITIKVIIMKESNAVRVFF